jgi:hypothetical protein
LDNSNTVALLSSCCGRIQGRLSLSAHHPLLLQHIVPAAKTALATGFFYFFFIIIIF